jgi:hypothetical protein
MNMTQFRVLDSLDSTIYKDRRDFWRVAGQQGHCRNHEQQADGDVISHGGGGAPPKVVVSLRGGDCLGEE